MAFHSDGCEKVVSLRGSSSCTTRTRRTTVRENQPRSLLLLSHLSCCLDDLKERHPHAMFIEILRDPVPISRSAFAGLSDVVINSATGCCPTFNICI